MSVDKTTREKRYIALKKEGSLEVKTVNLPEKRPKRKQLLKVK